MKRLLTILTAVFAAVSAAMAQDAPMQAPAADAATLAAWSRAAEAMAMASQAPATEAANAAATEPAPKKPGVIRLGLVQPKLEMGAGATPEALRSVLTRYLSGPQIEVVPITGMVPVQVEADARQKGCDYLFYASLAQKQGRRFGLLRAAQAMTYMVPVIGMAGRAATVLGHAAAMTAVNAAAQLSSGVTAKSEVTFEYQLLASAATSPILADSQKAKAESNGQDVITPLIEQAATAVANLLLKK